MNKVSIIITVFLATMCFISEAAVKKAPAANIDSLETAEIRTSCIRMNFRNDGNIGNGGNLQTDGNYNLAFFDDCDTTANGPGNNDNAWTYLYESSPFIAYIHGIDTTFNYAMYNSNWLSGNGFRPLGNPTTDSTGYPDYQYGYSGGFITQDSLVKIEMEYYAPSHPDSCNFIVAVSRFINISEDNIYQAFIGQIMDWDIPSDTGVENGSGYDESRNLMYMYGGEYGPDSIANNDCVTADQRCGGIAFFGGYRYVQYHYPGDSTIIYPKSMWTGLNADWVYPTGGFVQDDLYARLLDAGYQCWQSTHPEMEDSLYQDLHMVSCYLDTDFYNNDTLCFMFIMAVEQTGGSDALKLTVDKAVAWIEGRSFLHPFVGSCYYGDLYNLECVDVTLNTCNSLGGPTSLFYPRFGCNEDPYINWCDCRPGDANWDQSWNILDIIYMINYLYKNGPPMIYQVCEGDVDCNCGLNILDVTRYINYLYKNGPPPPTCDEWILQCGPPMR